LPVSNPAWHDTKERIRQAIDIVELVGGYIPLRREGRNYKGLCPWHDDSRPSLHVNPERQSFKCWVCDIGGDIFSFFMKMEKVEFPEALRMLAERAGIALPTGRMGSSGADADEKASLYRAMAWAEERFHQCLTKEPDAEPARRYLAERQISAESVRRFRLGFAPDRWDWLIKQALNTELSTKVLETVGLIVRKQDGPGHYDRFRGRVLFPIRDVQGRPVAIGGRILPSAATDPQRAEGVAKYVNSPETPLFSKSAMLYALDSARDSIGRTRNVVVMEGYTDTIVARQFGFDTTVAVLGTALGERHIRLLRRFADSITLVLDGDEAGQRRANEILGLFVAEQVDLRIVTLPDGLDPADFLLTRGAEAFELMLAGAVDALEHKLNDLGHQLGSRPATHQVNQALEQMLATLSRAPRLQAATSAQVRLREHQVLARLSRQFGVVEEQLRARLVDLRKRAAASKPETNEPGAAPRQAASPMQAWERELLEVILLEPEGVAAAAEVVSVDEIESAQVRDIFTHCCELSQAGITPDFDRLMLEFDDPATKSLLVDLDEEGRAKSAAEPASRLRDLLEALKRRRQQQDVDRQTNVLRERRLEADDELAVLEQLIEHERTRQGISSPMEG
jgi:DNA primase